MGGFVTVLIIVTHVYSGTTITMHDFNSADKCEAAKALVLKADKSFNIRSAFCVEK